MEEKSHWILTPQNHLTGAPPRRHQHDLHDQDQDPRPRHLPPVAGVRSAGRRLAAVWVGWGDGVLRYGQFFMRSFLSRPPRFSLGGVHLPFLDDSSSGVIQFESAIYIGSRGVVSVCPDLRRDIAGTHSSCPRFEPPDAVA